MTRAITYKRVCHSSPLLRYCLGVMLLLPSVGKAVVEGIPCTPEPTNMIVSYGDVVNCRIDPIGDLDVFRFSGAAGEVVRVQTSDLGGTRNSGFEVFGPDGTLICARLFGDPENCQLAQGGAHTILVSEAFNSSTVDYALALERIAPPSVAARPIDYSQVLSDEINGVGDIDAFVFGGGANDLVRVQTSDLGGTRNSGFEVFGPDGTLICARLFGDPENCQLAQGGVHTILVSEAFNSSTVLYSLALECIVGVCPPPPPPAAPPPPEAEPATPQTPIPCTGSGCRAPIICNLPEDQGVQCTNRIDLFAFVRRAPDRSSGDTSAKAPRRIRFAFGISNVARGEIKNVRLRLTPRGKRIVKMGKRRLRAVVEIRNTPGDLIDTTPVKIRIR